MLLKRGRGGPTLLLQADETTAGMLTDADAAEVARRGRSWRVCKLWWGSPSNSAIVIRLARTLLDLDRQQGEIVLRFLRSLPPRDFAAEGGNTLFE